MIKRAWPVLLASIMAFGSVTGQVPGDFKFYLLGGANYRTIDWESWNKMATSFNTGWQNSLSAPITNFEPMIGYNFGAAIRFLVFSVEVKRYGYGSQTRSFIFKNGDRREMEFDSKGWDMNFPIIVPVSKYVNLGMDMEVNIEKGNLHSRIVYANGTVSYGNESPMNGIFNFNNYWTAFIGPRIEIGKRVRGQLSVMWPLGGAASKDVVGVQDKGSDYGSVWSNGDKTVYLVSDFNQRNNYNYYYVGLDSESLVQRRIKGMKVELTIAVDLFKRTLIK